MGAVTPMIEQASHEAASSKIDWLRRGLFIGLHLIVALAVTFGVQLKYGVYYVLSIGTLAAIRRLGKPRRRRTASRLKFTREGKYMERVNK